MYCINFIILAQNISDLNFSDELKIGAMTVVALAIGILGFYYLKGVPLFKKTNKIYVLLEDAASVSPASPVAMHGIRIGKVNSVTQEQHIVGLDTMNVVFFINLDRGARVPKNSAVEIVELDLLGNKELRIVPTSSNANLESGDTILGSIKGGMMAMLEDQLDETLGPLLEKINPLIGNVDTLVQSVNSSLMTGGDGSLDDMIKTLSRTLDNVEGITKKVDKLIVDQTENIGGIIDNANVLTSSLANNSGKIDSIIGNFATLSGQLSEMDLDNIIESANNIVDDIEKLTASLNNADGTLGKLLKEDDIYQGLDSTLISVNALIEDLMANPKKYVSFSLIGRKN